MCASPISLSPCIAHTQSFPANPKTLNPKMIPNPKGVQFPSLTLPDRHQHTLRIDLMDIPTDQSESSDDRRVPFFGRRRSEHTWVVSLFVVIKMVAFVATMLVNDCPGNGGGAGGCVLRLLGRFSFQSLYENPLLGPSYSTLVKMGGLQRSSTFEQSKLWYLMISPWLHAGLIHLIVNLSSIILIGHQLEQEFGPLRTAIIYLLSAVMGCTTAAMFVEHIPAVGSSGPLFGLLGAMLAALIKYWHIYSAKYLALAMIGVVAAINFGIGLLPIADTFSSIGGFCSGILLGIVLLFNPQLTMMERKKGIFDYDLNRTVKLRQKLDKPIPRVIALILFLILLAGGLLGVYFEANLSKHCGWCQYINCVPSKMWSCNDKKSVCKASVRDRRLTLKCMTGGKFRTYPFAKVSQERINDLCSLLCS